MKQTTRNLVCLAERLCLLFTRIAFIGVGRLQLYPSLNHFAPAVFQDKARGFNSFCSIIYWTFFISWDKLRLYIPLLSNYLRHQCSRFMCANYWKNINWISTFSPLKLCLHWKIMWKERGLIRIKRVRFKKQTNQQENFKLWLRIHAVTKYGISWMFTITFFTVSVILVHKYTIVFCIIIV